MAEVQRPGLADFVLARQIRAARGLLGWTQDELAGRSGIARRTILGLETGRRIPRDDTIASVVAALEDAGIEFFAETDRVGAILKLSEELVAATTCPRNSQPRMS